jgi:hypothetical protein
MPPGTQRLRPFNYEEVRLLGHLGSRGRAAAGVLGFLAIIFGIVESAFFPFPLPTSLYPLFLALLAVVAAVIARNQRKFANAAASLGGPLETEGEVRRLPGRGAGLAVTLGAGLVNLPSDLAGAVPEGARCHVAFVSNDVTGSATTRKVALLSVNGRLVSSVQVLPEVRA